MRKRVIGGKYNVEAGSVMRMRPPDIADGEINRNIVTLRFLTCTLDFLFRQIGSRYHKTRSRKADCLGSDPAGNVKNAPPLRPRVFDNGGKLVCLMANARIPVLMYQVEQRRQLIVEIGHTILFELSSANNSAG